MIKELFDEEKRIVNHFFEHVDIQAVEKLLEWLKECKGVIILTGIGKSSLVAEKIALTMTSTGSRAFYLSSGNALHGDIGIVTEQDVFIMISKSGESEELLQMIPALRNKGVKIAAICHKKNSRLAKSCDLALILPLEKELCPHDLAPTTSTVTQMILGDVLAIALMQHKNFSLAEFALNHPAGKIGRRLTLKVKDLMLKGENIPFGSIDDKLVDSLVELSNKRCGCLIIVDKHNKLKGIFTDGDLRRALQKNGPDALNLTMEALMTKTPKWIHDLALATEALSMMEGDQKHPITALPVLNEEHVVTGVIKMHDIVQSGL